MPSAVRNYSSTVPAKTISNGGTAITNSATSIPINSATGLPSTPFTMVIEPDTTNEEIITVTAVVGTTLTVTRGEDSTTAVAHNDGSALRHMITARDLTDSRSHIDASTSVHGVSGSVVGTTSTQTLTNKTISGSSNTLSNIPKASVTGTAITAADTGTVTNAMLAGSIAQSKITDLGTDLAAKAPLAGPTFTGTVTLPSTTSIGTVSSTEIGYLDGVTSSVQTQLDAKSVAGATGIPYRMQAGKTSITGSGSISFAASRFTYAPIVVATVEGTGASYGTSARVSGVTTSGATIKVYAETGDSTTARDVHWIAIQMTSSASAG